MKKQFHKDVIKLKEEKKRRKCIQMKRVKTFISICILIAFNCLQYIACQTVKLTFCRIDEN